jgi:hypothetical protein
MPTTLKPLARSSELVVQDVEDEVLIYDQYNGLAHCLNVEAARIWRACDGQTSKEEIAAALEVDVDVVSQALADLDSKALLQVGPSLNGSGPSLNGNGTTRREFGVRAAKVGGAVAVAPTIYSIIAPTALATATTPNFLCNYYSGSSCDACSEICGCCCCCQGCSTATVSACKMCSSVDFCDAAQANVKAGNKTQDGCLDQLKVLVPGATVPCTSGPNCSVEFNPDKCSPPCTGGFPTLDCGTHDCNCFGDVSDNPCDFN